MPPLCYLNPKINLHTRSSALVYSMPRSILAMLTGGRSVSRRVSRLKQMKTHCSLARDDAKQVERRCPRGSGSWPLPTDKDLLDLGVKCDDESLSGLLGKIAIASQKATQHDGQWICCQFEPRQSFDRQSCSSFKDGLCHASPPLVHYSSIDLTSLTDAGVAVSLCYGNGVPPCF